jgi:2-dehydro-3-deoxygluconokinase
MTVVTLGETMLRLSPPRGDQLNRANQLEITIGGAESNVAVALAALGVSARWIGAVPRNELGDRVISDLSAAAVDVSQVVWRDLGRLGLYFVEVPVPPRPARVVYDRRDSAMTTISADELGSHALEDASHAVVSGVTAALKPHGAELARTFFARALRQGCRRILDMNFRRQLWEPSEAAATLTALAREADVLFCSAADARSLFDFDGPDEDLPAALRRVATNASFVVVTLGERGAIAWDKQAGCIAARPPAVEVADPLGAGDALVAGVIWAELAGQNAGAQLEAGVALASLACTVRGDHARFDVATLKAVLAGVSGKALR